MLKLVASSVTNSGICTNIHININIVLHDRYFSRHVWKSKKIRDRIERNTIQIRETIKEIVNNGKYDSNFLVIYAERSFLVVEEEEEREKKNDK